MTRSNKFNPHTDHGYRYRYSHTFRTMNIIAYSCIQTYTASAYLRAHSYAWYFPMVCIIFAIVSVLFLFSIRCSMRSSKYQFIQKHILCARIKVKKTNQPNAKNWKPLEKMKKKHHQQTAPIQKKITEVTTAPTSAMTKTLYCSFSHPPLVRANRRHFSLAIAHMIHTH